LEDGPCEQCGLPHGEHEAWLLVFSDDPQEVVEKVFSGEINRVRCQRCGCDGGWLWPSSGFLYVDLEEERGALVSLEASPAIWDVMLKESLSHLAFAVKDVNLERLRNRCAAVFDYMKIVEALEKPVEQIEIESRAATAAAERIKLYGHDRVRKLLESALAIGSVTLCDEESSEDFLYTLRHFSQQNYESLSESEKCVLDQTIGLLEQHFSIQAPQHEKPKHPPNTQLDQMLRLMKENHQNIDNYFSESFKAYCNEAERQVYRDRLDFLLEIAADGYLSSDAIRPIDFHEGFREFAKAELGESKALNGEEAGLSSPSPPRITIVKKYLKETEGVKALFDTFEFDDPRGGAQDPLPECHWGSTLETLLFEANNNVIEKRYELALRKLGSLREHITIGSSPYYEAQMHSLLGDTYLGLGKLAEAEAHYRESLRIAIDDSQGEMVENCSRLRRGAGVAAERLADFTYEQGLLEQALELYDLAMEFYRETRSIDGIESCCQRAGGRLLDYGQVSYAEGYFRQAVELSRGRCDANDVRNLLNLSSALHIRAMHASLPEMVMRFGSGAEEEAGKEGVDEYETPWGKGEESDTVQAEIVGTEVSHTDDSSAATRENLLLSMSLGMKVTIVTPEESEMPSFNDIVGGEIFGHVHRALKIAELSGQGDLRIYLLGVLAEDYYNRGCVEWAAWLLRHIEGLGTPLTKAGIGVMEVGSRVYMRNAEEADARRDAEAVRVALRQAIHLLEASRDNFGDKEKASYWVGAQLTDSNRLRIDMEIGSCYESLGDFEKAGEVYERACATFENLRTKLTEVNYKRGIQTDRIRVYVRAARNLYSWHKASGGAGPPLSEIVNKVDCCRSRVLLDSVVERVSGGNDKSDGSGPSAPPNEIDVSRAIATLPFDTTVLQYALFPTAINAPGRWALFAQTGGEVAPRVEMETEQLDSVLEAKRMLDVEADRIESALTKIAAASLPHSESVSAINRALYEEPGYTDALVKLSDLLLPGDLAERLARAGIKRLVVSPDAYLYDVPWVSLTPLVRGKRRPLIGDDEWEGFEVAIAPSIASFMAASDRASNYFMGGADDFSKVLLAADPLGDLSSGDPGLQTTLDEIVSALEGVGCDVKRLDGAQVTKAGFIGAGRAARAIIYVGHADVAPEGAGGGARMLISDGDGGMESLSSDELAQLPDTPVFARCEMAVLLACSSGRTAAGGWKSDREVAGLSAAYMLQGCLSVVAPVRLVLSTPGLIFLNGFVQELTDGRTLGESLRLALRRLAGAGLIWSHPFFWGYLSLHGRLDGDLGRLTKNKGEL